jgi:hypothetical protein
MFLCIFVHCVHKCARSVQKALGLKQLPLDEHPRAPGAQFVHQVHKVCNEHTVHTKHT